MTLEELRAVHFKMRQQAPLGPAGPTGPVGPLYELVPRAAEVNRQRAKNINDVFSRAASEAMARARAELYGVNDISVIMRGEQRLNTMKEIRCAHEELRQYWADCIRRRQAKADQEFLERKTTAAMLSKASELITALRETTNSQSQHDDCELVLSWIKDRQERGS